MSCRDDPVAFELPQARHNGWRTVFDTARTDAEIRTQLFAGGQAYPMLGRSFVLLEDA